MSKFSPKLAELERPLRELTKINTVWVWQRDQERSFESIKRLLSHAPVLAKFKLKAEHKVTADSS